MPGESSISTRQNVTDDAFGSSDPAFRDQPLFWTMLQDCAKDALRSALGDVILGILSGQKMLDDLSNATEFTDRLKVVFGTSGAKTLQFVIMKELYRRLSLPFKPDGSFDYATFLQDAKKSFTTKKKN